MADYRCYLTKAGITAENNAKQFGDVLTITEMVFDGAYLDDNLKPEEQTAVLQEVLSVPCSGSVSEDGQTITFKGSINVEQGGFNVWGIGLRTSDGILYGYARSKGDKILTQDEGATESVRYSVDVITQNADVVEVLINRSEVYADLEDLDKMMTDHVGKEDPHEQYLLKTDGWKQPALAIGNKTTEIDLNDVTDVGFYASNASSNLFKNLPEGYNSGAFTLFIESIDAKSKYRRQTLRSWLDCRDYTRFRDYLGNWSEKWTRINTAIFDYLVGFPMFDTIPNSDRSAIALRADGVEVPRADYPKLWNKMKHTAIDQTLINANPKEYAARYGTGDGSTTFTMPNLTLMPWLAVAGFYGAAGTTCNDAIRNMTGMLRTNYSIGEGTATSTGVFQDSYGDSEFTITFGGSGDNQLAGDFSFDASRVVPTAEVNRPNTSFFDLYIIHGEI